MTTLLNIFRQAWLNAPLSPAERGLLRAVKSSVISALISAVFAGAALLTGGQTITLDLVLGVLLGTFIHTLVDSVAKYQAANAEAAISAPSAQPAVPVAQLSTPSFTVAPASLAITAAAQSSLTPPADAPIAPVATS